MQQVLLLLTAIALVAFLEGARQIYRWAEEKRAEELRRRLRALRDEDRTESILLRRDRLAASPGIDALLRHVPLALRLERILQQADSRFTVAQMIGWSALLACGGVVLTSVLRLGVALGAVLVLIGLAIPTVLLIIARERRSQRLSEQLPEALDMMARSLRAGHALTAAFEVVAGEMPEPVAVEFGRAFEAQRLGISSDQAIVQMTERSPGNRDLQIFAVSVVIQRETGGNLAELLGNIAETIRARYRFYGKLRSLTAEGRASALVLGSLPFGMALFLRIVNPKYLVPLGTTSMGRAILAGAVIAWLSGIIWMYRMTKVDI
jgi:tight adherence protein B